MIENTGIRRLLFSALGAAALSGGLTAQGGAAAVASAAAPADASAPVPWATWWSRHREHLGAPAPRRVVPTHAASPFRPSRLDATLVPFASTPKVDVAASLADLADPSKAPAAALRLGLSGDAAALGLLESLLFDDDAGRRLAGVPETPAGLRVAAAFALGLSGRPAGYGALRSLLGDGRARPDAVEAAAQLALTLASDPDDADGAWSYLRDG
ncbi:MAG TPA: hypothetical protein VEI02_17265, partial [Planctomycetota bacterium]|nr:hypothetical protein [Planctomycetota bacterium]